VLPPLSSSTAFPFISWPFPSGRKKNRCYKQCCGSGIRCLFDPWIRDG
jgi:hypothetical protein